MPYAGTCLLSPMRTSRPPVESTLPTGSLLNRIALPLLPNSTPTGRRHDYMLHTGLDAVSHQLRTGGAGGLSRTSAALSSMSAWVANRKTGEEATSSRMAV